MQASIVASDSENWAPQILRHPLSDCHDEAQLAPERETPEHNTAAEAAEHSTDESAAERSADESAAERSADDHVTDDAACMSKKAAKRAAKKANKKALKDFKASTDLVKAQSIVAMTVPPGGLDKNEELDLVR